MKTKARLALGAFTVLVGLATIAGFICAIWTDDARWALTSSVGILATYVGAMVCAYPGWNS